MVLPPSEVWQFGLAKLGIFKNEWPHACREGPQFNIII